MLLIKATQEKEISLVGTTFKLESVFVYLQITLPIVKDIIIFKPVFFQTEEMFNTDIKNQIRTDIQARPTHGIDGIATKLKESESQGIEQAIICAKDYFVSLGYAVEVL